MRLVLSLVTVLALALTGCAGGTTDTTGTTDTPTDTTGAPTGTDQSSMPDDGDTDEVTADPDDGGAAQGGTADPATDPATDETDSGVAAEGDCSAAGLPAGVATEVLGAEAGATAAFLLDAAVRCDEQLLFTAAEESGTTFFFGSATFDDVFGLPEDPEQDPAP